MCLSKSVGIKLLIITEASKIKKDKRLHIRATVKICQYHASTPKESSKRDEGSASAIVQAHKLKTPEMSHGEIMEHEKLAKSY